MSKLQSALTIADIKEIARRRVPKNVFLIMRIRGR